MTKPIKKISLILFFIILIPVVFFTFREITSLNENEKVIEDIYKKQLDAILFSVNQYSEDIVRSWSINLETLFENKSSSDPVLLKQLKDQLKENKAVKYVFITDSSFCKNTVYSLEKENIKLENNSEHVCKALLENKVLLNKLVYYRKNNFVKIEPLKSKEVMDARILVFVLDDKRVCGIIIDPPVFVKQNLSSKIQSVEREDFAVAVFDSANNKNIYSAGETAGKYQQSKNLWFFPDYSLGISLRGTTIESLVRDRTNTNFILIVGMGILMIIAAWYGYKNIKKEVELAQIKSDFVSNVSHELRTPLALISMFAETLSMGRVKNEEKRDEYYHIIQQEIERLSKIVNKILSFSKIESGAWKYNFSFTEINSMLEKIYTTYKFHLQNKGFEFLLELPENVIVADIDPEAISEAVINLIDNAVKYSGDRKKVILRSGIENDKIFIEVQDEGMGIASADKKKIFDKFYRITSGDIHNTKGTGLGLTLVNHIVEAHKGQINLISELGVGSSFRILLPVNK